MHIRVLGKKFHKVCIPPIGKQHLCTYVKTHMGLPQALKLYYYFSSFVDLVSGGAGGNGSLGFDLGFLQ